MTGRLREVVLPLALVLASIGLFFSWFVPAHLFDEGPTSLRSSFDFHSYFRPRFWLGSDEIWRGRLPLWNPYEWGGIPLLGTGQPAVLYPPKILLFGLFRPVTANWIFLILHHVMAAGGFFWFLRREGVRGAGLFVGTALWCFGTPLLASNYHPVRVACLSWMPIIFILSARLAGSPDLRTFALLALSVTFQILAGYPEFTIDLGLLVAIHATVSWLQKKFTLPPWKTVPLLAAAFALGGLAAAVQLVPIGELATVARRVALANLAGDLPKPTAVEVPLPVVPGLVVFALIGVWLRRARSGAIGYLMCWGIAAGLWRVLRYMPGFSMVRFPLAWVMLALYYFAWLGGVGMDALLRAENGIGPRLRRGALALVGVSGLALASLWLLSFRAFVAAPNATTPLASIYRFNIGGLPGVAFGVAGGLALAAAAMVSLLRRKAPEWPWLAAAALVANAHLAAYPHGANSAPFDPPYSRGQVVRLHGHRKEITGRTFAPRDLLWGYEITDRLPDALGVEISFLPWRCRKILEKISFLPTFGYVDWPKVMQARGFWNAMDVQFLVAHVSLLPLLRQHGFMPVREHDGDILFHNPQRLGHAWVNYAVRRVSSADRALDHVMAGGFDPSREVVVEEPTRGTYPSMVLEPVTAPTSERRYSPTDVEFEVELRHPGILVVSESSYPGWEATVDGAPSPWLTVDYLLRGVELPPGPHRVRFTYRPASFRWGVALSGLGLLGIAGAYATGRRRRRRRARRRDPVPKAPEPAP